MKLERNELKPNIYRKRGEGQKVEKVLQTIVKSSLQSTISTG